MYTQAHTYIRDILYCLNIQGNRTHILMYIHMLVQQLFFGKTNVNTYPLANVVVLAASDFVLHEQHQVGPHHRCQQFL